MNEKSPSTNMMEVHSQLEQLDDSKFGSLLNLCVIFNLFWIGFLVYQVSDNFWLVIGVVAFQLFLFPKVVLKLYF